MSCCIELGRNTKDAVFWVNIDLAIRKGLRFYQTRSNAIIFQGTIPACCIPKVVKLKRKVLHEKWYMSPRLSPKISLRHDHDWTRGKVQLGSTVDQQPEGKVVGQSRGEVQHATFSQPCLLMQVKRPVPMGWMKKIFTKNSVLQTDQGNLKSRLAWLKLVIYLKTSVLNKLTMDWGNVMSSAHTVKEQHAPEEQREIASFNGQRVQS